MGTLLVGGAFAQLLDVYSLDLVNKEQLHLDQALPFCQQSKLGYEQLLITDDGMAGLDDYTVKSALVSLMLFQENRGRVQPILLMTSRASLQAMSVTGVSIEIYYGVRIPIQKYINAISGNNSNRATKKTSKPPPADKSDEKQAAKRGIIERFRKEEKKEPTAPFAGREFEMISRDISRVIAITGQKGSGVTSTAVNLAHIANNRNLSTILIDLDTVNCAFNLYFSDFYEQAEKDQDIACSLIRNLAKPQNYNINSHHIDNLYIVTLAYSFSDKELLERFFTSPKLINMLTFFRKHFQLCLLDMPLEALVRLKECILYVDLFGLCVSNNLYSLTGTLRGFQNVLTDDDLEMLFSKTAIIVSKYNEHIRIQDDFFSPDKVCDLLLELNDVPLAREFELAGHIPYHLEFDTQLETDIPIADSDAYMEKAYSDILLRMIKGAG